MSFLDKAKETAEELKDKAEDLVDKVKDKLDGDAAEGADTPAGGK